MSQSGKSREEKTAEFIRLLATLSTEDKIAVAEYIKQLKKQYEQHE